MTKISINQTSSATRDGHLKIKDGLPISGSLQIVADEFNTSSTLQLSTLSAKVDSDFYVSGDVGIGTDTPSVALEIVNSTNPEIIINNGGGTSPSPKLTFYRQAGVSAEIAYDVASKKLFMSNLFSGAGSDIIFGTNGGTEAMRINSSRNVGIGTSSPSTKLTVVSPDAPNFNNDTHQGESIFVRGSNSSGDGNAQAVIAFGKADGSSSRSGSAIASVQTDADTDKIGLGFYTSPSSSSSQTMQQQMLIDHLGNVGIGTSSPTAPLMFGKSVYGGFGSEDFYRIKLQDNGGINNDVGIGQTTSGSMGFNIGVGGEFIFNDGTNGEIARLDGDGLKFNGDTAAANALDDYEEGTFTPTLEFGGGTTAIVYVVQLGKYTKVGNKVTCEVAITLSNKGTDTGDVSITGFPFTHVAAYRAGVSFANVVSISFADFLQGFIEGGQTAVFLREVTNAGVTTALNDTNFANNTTLYFSITYLSA